MVALTSVKLTFTFIGFEAAWVDYFKVNGNFVFRNDADPGRHV